MFDNIGSKVKGLATFVCVMGIVGALIYAIIIWLSGVQYSGILGFVVLLVGALVAWIGSWVTYAIGEAADQKHTLSALQLKIARIEESLGRLANTSSSVPEPKVVSNNTTLNISSQPQSTSSNVKKVPDEIKKQDYDIKNAKLAANISLALAKSGNDSGSLMSMLTQLSNRYYLAGKHEESQEIDAMLKSSNVVETVESYISSHTNN